MKVTEQSWEADANITIDEFKTKIIEDLDKFIAAYKESMLKQPDVFDAKMWYADWREQFDMHPLD